MKLAKAELRDYQAAQKAAKEREAARRAEAAEKAKQAAEQANIDARTNTDKDGAAK
jgi:hypothetical protein